MLQQQIHFGMEQRCWFLYKKNSLDPESISVRDVNNEAVKIVSSRSHPSPKLQAYLNKFENHEIVNMGSSLKFAWLQMVVLIYIQGWPNHGMGLWGWSCGVKICRWFLTDTTTNEELVYNKENLLNPDFICYGSAIKKNMKFYSIIVFIGVIFCQSGYDIAKSMSNRKSPWISSRLVMTLKDKRKYS